MVAGTPALVNELCRRRAYRTGSQKCPGFGTNQRRKNRAPLERKKLLESDKYKSEERDKDKYTDKDINKQTSTDQYKEAEQYRE